MTGKRLVRFAVVTVGTVVLVQVAGLWAAEESAVPPETAATTSPSYPRAERLPEHLLDPRPRQVIVLPTEPRASECDPGPWSSAVVAKLTPESHRLPEGYIIANRRGRVEKQDDWHVALLNSEAGLPDSPPLRILPNERLGMLQAILKETFADQAPEFMFTGRVTEFQGANYILLENLVELLPHPKSNAQSGGPQAVDGVGDGASATTRPTEAREPTAEEVVQQLMQSAPRAVRMPERRADVTVSVPTGPDGRADDGPRWPEETMLIDQVGRVLPADSGYQFVFEDRGSAATSRPIRVLPSRLLESALAASGAGTRGVVFIVTGEITVYQGNNYLLLRKVLQRRDLGNLR